jgi:hypothetical protein
MANEVIFRFRTGQTCGFLVFNRNGQVWRTDTNVFENYASANYANYPTSAVGQGTSSPYYVGNFPSAIPAGVYSISAFQQIGGSPAETDPVVATGDFQWNGTAEFPLSDLCTSGQAALISPVKVYRGEQILHFPFKMVSSADHITPFVSGVVSGQVSRDGGAFGALQSGAFTEIGLGWYQTTLTSGDLLGNTVALVFTANGISGGQADQRDFGFILQKVSGSF